MMFYSGMNNISGKVIIDIDYLCQLVWDILLILQGSCIVCWEYGFLLLVLIDQL